MKFQDLTGRKRTDVVYDDDDDTPDDKKDKDFITVAHVKKGDARVSTVDNSSKVSLLLCRFCVELVYVSYSF